MTTFATAGVETRVPDPGKHVSYTLGMLLGVDDFNQEFAYLSGRTRWLARDAVGYGTLVGLRVAQEATAKGPRITVTSGAALLPTGQLVCVGPAQCGSLNDWLAANGKDLPTPVPPTLPLYLTLGHRECPVDPVPIPGEPCRTEDELLAPSRLADDFQLEFETTPPDQREEELVREYVAALRRLAFGGGGTFATVEALVSALRASVTETPESPPASPPTGSDVHFIFGPALQALTLDPARAPDYLGAALRVWATELRPRVHSPGIGATRCCGGDGGDDAPPTGSSVLLARVDVPLVDVGGSVWKVDETRPIAIDESRRPVAVSTRVLQEWVATAAGTGARGGVAIPAVPQIVAAGIVGATGAQPPVFGNLSVSVRGPSQIQLGFGTYAPPNGSFQYVVKAMALAGGPGNPTIAFDGFARNGVNLRVTNGAQVIAEPALTTMRFMVEITRVQA